MNEDCELCRLYKRREIKTRLYYEDAKVIIVDCLTCGIPMVVWKEHKQDLKADEIEYIDVVVKLVFGEDIKIRRQQRKIKDHFHWHIIKE